MAADRDRVLKRVTETLSLSDIAAYTKRISPRNRRRHPTAIEDLVDEAGLRILRSIAERPNEFRSVLSYDTAAITTNGDPIPASAGKPHLGSPIAIKITLSSGGTVRDGIPMDYRRIGRYRELPADYDPNSLAHNVVGSTLGGYYDIWNNRFFFTGYSAILTLARTPVKADTATLVPDVFENVWVNLGIGGAARVGPNEYDESVIGTYGKLGLADLEKFESEHPVTLNIARQ